MLHLHSTLRVLQCSIAKRFTVTKQTHSLIFIISSFAFNAERGNGGKLETNHKLTCLFRRYKRRQVVLNPQWWNPWDLWISVCRDVCMCICFQATGGICPVWHIPLLQTLPDLLHKLPSLTSSIPLVLAHSNSGTFGGNVFACRDAQKDLRRFAKEAQGGGKWEETGFELISMQIVYVIVPRKRVFVCVVGVQYVICLEAIKLQSTWGAKETILCEPMRACV